MQRCPSRLARRAVLSTPEMASVKTSSSVHRGTFDWPQAEASLRERLREEPLEEMGCEPSERFAAEDFGVCGEGAGLRRFWLRPLRRPARMQATRRYEFREP